MNCKIANKYDYMIIILISSLAFGNMGGAMHLNRILTILFVPFIFSYPKILEKNHIKNYVIFFIILISYSIISLLWSYNPLEGCVEIIYLILYSCLFIELYIFSLLSTNPLKSIIYGWTISLCITLSIGCWELVTDHHLSTSKLDSGHMNNIGDGVIILQKFAAATFVNYNTYVSFLCFALPFLLYSISYSKRYKLYKFLLFTLCVICILSNASRGGLLSITTMIIVYMLCKHKYKYLLTIGIIFSIIISFILDNTDISFLTLISHRASAENLLNGDSRFNLWLVSVKILISTFFIGIGVGGMEQHFIEHNMSLHIPHNLIIELMLKFGLIIGCIVIFQFVYILFNIRRIKNHSIRILLYTALITFPIYSIINSGYILDEYVYATMACWIIFYNYGINRFNYQVLSKARKL